MAPLSVLLLCDDRRDHAGTVLDHIDALRRFSRHRVRKLGVRGAPEIRTLRLEDYDAVVLHYSLVITSDHYLPPWLRARIEAFEGLKVQFIQDEYRWVDDVTAEARRLGIRALFTVLPAHEAERLYRPRLHGVRLVQTLTGYVPDRLASRPVRPLTARPIDIGYRGRELPYWLGALGQEKVQIGRGVLERAAAAGLTVDIGWSEGDRIYGEAWLRFVSSCRAVLGTPSGASIADCDGRIEAAVRAHLGSRPAATFDEVSAAVLAEHEGNLDLDAVSPRVFEAAALGTVLVMFPGRYSGVVEPWRHYVPLERDFSNFDAVAAHVRDDVFMRELAGRTRSELVESSRFSYRRLAESFDAVLEEEVGERRAAGGLPGRHLLIGLEAGVRGALRSERSTPAPLRGLAAATGSAVLRRLASDPGSYVTKAALALRLVLGNADLRAVLQEGLARRPGGSAVRLDELLEDLLELELLRRREGFQVSPSLDADGGLRLTSHPSATAPEPRAAVDPGAVGRVTWDHRLVGVAAVHTTWFGRRVHVAVGEGGLHEFPALSAVARRRPGIVLAALRPVLPEAASAVEEYWGGHTVNEASFHSAEESERYLDWRAREYPLFPELMDCWGSHPGEVVLDYGCGPGDDLVGFLLHSAAARVIGMDVSDRALEHARGRLALHGFPDERVELRKVSDVHTRLPLPSRSVDYVHCGGVLHHCTQPLAVLRELRRVLRRRGEARIMVYNRDSLWYHLYVAYIRMVLEGKFPGVDVDAAFTRSTDGDNCPVSRAYRPAEVLALARAAGFQAEYLGGYLSRWELQCWRDHPEAAADPRLAAEHREFLSTLTHDEHGLPHHTGLPAGIGGTYHLRRR